MCHFLIIAYFTFLSLRCEILDPKDNGSDLILIFFLVLFIVFFLHCVFMFCLYKQTFFLRTETNIFGSSFNLYISGIKARLKETIYPNFFTKKVYSINNINVKGDYQGLIPGIVCLIEIYKIYFAFTRVMTCEMQLKWRVRLFVCYNASV